MSQDGSINHDLSEPQQGKIWAVIGICSFIIFGLLLFSIYLFKGTVSTEIIRKENMKTSYYDLSNLRAKEKILLKNLSKAKAKVIKRYK